MAPPAGLVPLLLALWVTPAAAAGNYSVFAVSKTGVMHLDSDGFVLAWRADTDLRGAIAINPSNNTVCWIKASRDPKLGNATRHAVRCAEPSQLNLSWDFPLPLNIDPSRVMAFTYDEVTQNWYLTIEESIYPVQKDGIFRYNVFGSYVCDSVFSKCLQLIEEVPGEFARFQVAYDTYNHLMSYITTEERYTYRLKVSHLDGTAAKSIDIHIRSSRGMALDPIGRHVYWLNRPAIYGRYTDVNRATYDGKSTAQVKRVNDAEHITDIDALDNRVALVRKNRTIISILDATTGEMTDLFSGDVKLRTPNPALVEPEDLLAVKLVPTTPIPETENGCSGATGSCKDFCIPTVADGTPAATCLCPEGLQLVELACREEQPSLALLIGADRLQAADLRTERVSTILTNLTAGRRVDVYRPPDGHQLLLFWLDAGSLFGGRWSPGGSVTDVQLLEPATDTETVEEVAVYTSQRQLYWIKKAQSEDGSGSSMVVQMSPLDHSYTKTVLVGNWTEPNETMLYGAYGFILINKRFARQRSYLVTFGTNSKSICIAESIIPDSPDANDLGGIIMDESLAPNPFDERVWWIERSSQSIKFIYTFTVGFFLLGKGDPTPHVSHPSLADAGGLDTTDSRLFWTERTTGRLWSADKKTGGDVRAVADTTAGRSLRLVQPWLRPTIAPVCEDGAAGCSHFCRRYIPGYTSEPVEAKCDCPDGMHLRDDQKTCEDGGDASGSADEFPECVSLSAK